MTPHRQRSRSTSRTRSFALAHAPWAFAAAIVCAAALGLGVTSHSLAATNISGNVSGVWDLTGHPYNVVGNATVQGGQALTIQPGVIVRVTPGVTFQVFGTLYSAGTPAQPVTFTSRSDSTGGAPQPGDWYGLFVQSGSIVTIENTFIRYGGASGLANLCTTTSPAASVTWNGGYCHLSAGDGIRITANEISIVNIQADDNAADGIEVTPTYPPSFNNLDCNRNGGFAIRVNEGAGSFPSTLTGTGNGTNGIMVAGTIGGSGPSGRWRWDFNYELPYVITSLVTVATGDTLEIGDRSVIKFSNPGAFLHVTGAGACLRTLQGSGPVYITSIKDDQIGGDTNRDGMATMPAPGDWTAIFVNNGCTIDLKNTNILYGGAAGQANVATSAGPVASFSWSGGSTQYSANDGARVGAIDATISGLDARNNAADGFEITPTNPPVFPQFSVFYAEGNGGYAMRINQNPGSFPGNWFAQNNGVNGVYVTGQLGGPAPDQKWTWAANGGVPIVIGQLNVFGSDTLEIAALCTVKFDVPGSYLQISNAGSHLRTLGTDEAPVWFTSRKDDTQGGDTNNDGAASAPAGGDWTALFVNNSGTADLNGTHLAYGGASSWANLATSAGTIPLLNWNGGGTHNSANDGARVNCVNATLSNLEASGNGVDGIEITPTFPPVLDAIAANDNAAYGIRITQNPGSFPGNLTGSGNGVNGIYVNGQIGGAAANQKWTWGANPTFPYVLSITNCFGPDSLEIAAGAIVKFDSPGAYLQISNAGSHLRTLGTDEAPVWFTSRKDDTQGGDTNNDGAASAPAGGDWVALFVNNGAIAELDETWIAYGGGAGWANVAVSAGSSALGWNGGGTIRSAIEGIRGTYTGFDLERVRVAENTGRGISITPPAGASATNCDIYDNDVAGSSYGFYNNSTSVTVDATSSWWGDVTGPYDPSPGPPSINAGGLGERVTDYVNYGSWLSAPNTNQPPNAFALLSPANGAEILPAGVTFTWQASNDPEGTAITYNLLVDDDPAFASPVVSVTGIAATTYNAGDIPGAGPHYWRVIARDSGGGSRLCSPASFVFTFPAGTGIGPSDGTAGASPLAFEVRAPYPNPFRDASTLAFTLPDASRVIAEVYDVSGRLVRTLADQAMPRGEHALTWEGMNREGRSVAAGVYFYRLATDARTETRRVVLTR